MNRAVLWGCVGVLLTATVFAPVVATANTSSTTSMAVAAQENNSTTQHERPADASGDGSEADVRRWLNGRLSGVLAESTVRLSQGEYEAADRLLDEEYESYFGKYVDVVGETNEQDTEQERILAQAGDQQQTYVSQVQRYQRIYEQYQAAQANGNETGARKLARRLQRINANVSQTNASLTTTLADAGNVTEENLSGSIERIQSITANISRQQQTIVTESFTNTSLSLTATANTTSYTAPLRIQGRVTPHANTSLPDRIALRINGQSRTVSVAANGSFAFSYRPTTIETGERTIRVQYLPRPESVFLGSNASVTATVEAITPTIHVTEVDGPHRYGDRVLVGGRVLVNETAVEGVPIALSLGNTSLGTVITGEDGAFRVTRRLPAAVSTGQHRLETRIAQEGRAIAQTNGSTSVVVNSSETALSLTAAERSDAVILAGQLTTADGTPVHDQPVAVVRNGTRIATVTTNTTGHYTVSVARPRDAVEMRAVFDGNGTNLNSASETVLVAGSPPGPPPDSGIPLWLVLGGLLIAGVVVGIGGYAYRRRKPTTASTTTAVDADDAEAVAEVQPSTTDAQATIDRLATDDPSPEAVTTLYGVVRRELAASRPEEAAPQTHWEFYRAWASELGDDETALRSLTEQYERVTYAGGDLSETEWQTAVTAAEQLVDRTVFADEDTTGE